ncbi:MAG: hypothetical protein K2X48_05775 [Chitinophagaceae bacterium]|nr:hypothetical protein [Chitinophagaceae bacterium]
MSDSNEHKSGTVVFSRYKLQSCHVTKAVARSSYLNQQSAIIVCSEFGYHQRQVLRSPVKSGQRPASEFIFNTEFFWQVTVTIFIRKRKKKPGTKTCVSFLRQELKGVLIFYLR